MVDTTKKSNIKCENCKYRINDMCKNHLSPKYKRIVWYWNRCKQFEWKLKGEQK